MIHGAREQGEKLDEFHVGLLHFRPYEYIHPERVLFFTIVAAVQ